MEYSSKVLYALMRGAVVKVGPKTGIVVGYTDDVNTLICGVVSGNNYEGWFKGEDGSPSDFIHTSASTYPKGFFDVKLTDEAITSHERYPLNLSIAELAQRCVNLGLSIYSLNGYCPVIGYRNGGLLIDITGKIFKRPVFTRDVILKGEHTETWQVDPYNENRPLKF